jgi:hypothetical protein
VSSHVWTCFTLGGAPISLKSASDFLYISGPVESLMTVRRAVTEQALDEWIASEGE